MEKEKPIPTLQTFFKQQIDEWLVKQNEALQEAEKALQRARFAERNIDRLLAAAGLDKPVESPQLYLIQGGLEDG